MGSYVNGFCLVFLTASHYKLEKFLKKLAGQSLDCMVCVTLGPFKCVAHFQTGRPHCCAQHVVTLAQENNFFYDFHPRRQRNIFVTLKESPTKEEVLRSLRLKPPL